MSDMEQQEREGNQPEALSSTEDGRFRKQHYPWPRTHRMWYLSICFHQINHTVSIARLDPSFWPKILYRPLMLEGGGQALHYAKIKNQDVSFINCISWILSPYSQTPYCISLGILQRVGFSNFSPARSETASPVPGNTRTIHGESVLEKRLIISPWSPGPFWNCISRPRKHPDNPRWIGSEICFISPPAY